MPEPPDFERIADVCLAHVYEVRSKGLIAEHDVVVEHLRQVWNARGAADATAVVACLNNTKRLAFDDDIREAIIALDQAPIAKEQP